ncbi:MAG: RHS repeat protein [Armatimonadetes bacterium]|nr:RHS repeat protein [Armatimonadota bacterium]
MGAGGELREPAAGGARGTAGKAVQDGHGSPQPVSRVTSYDYYDNEDQNQGNRGQLKWVRDARYGTTGRQYEYTYNGYGQKTQEKNLNNIYTTYTYGDSWGNLTQVEQDPTGLDRTTSMTYGVAGRVTSSTDPMDRDTSFTYNGVGQPLTAVFEDETITYTYGSNGRVATVADDRGTTTISYESGNDRVASVSDPVTGTVSYTYEPTGERATVTLPGSDTWTYTYGSAFPGHCLPSDEPDKLQQRLTSITDDEGRRVDYEVDSRGVPRVVYSDQTFQNGTRVSYLKTTYTPELTAGALRITRGLWATVSTLWHDTGGDTLINENDYSYDTIGNRDTNAVSDDGGLIRTEDYDYDELYRLTGVDYDDGEEQTFVFDPMGNRTRKTIVGQGYQDYTYNNANMLLTRGGQNYTNDAAGNTLTDAAAGRSMDWDCQNRMVECVYNNTTSTFTYGADGLRRSKTVGQNTTDYQLDGQSVVGRQSMLAWLKRFASWSWPHVKDAFWTEAIGWIPILLALLLILGLVVERWLAQLVK